jgi:DNA-binding NarL/FixJ family response regulator
MRMLAILAGVAEWLLVTGQPKQAAELLVVILHHPASDWETRDRTRKLLLRCETALAPDVFAAATQHVYTAGIDSVLARLGIVFGPAGVASGSAAEYFEASAPAPLGEPLTERELAVLRLIAEGRSNQEISERLIISLGTAKWYASQIFGKLDVHSRTQAVMQARARGILS